MVMYTGLRRTHVHEGAHIPLGGYMGKPKRLLTDRVSAFASTDTYEERQKRQADGLREFTNQNERLFLSDATLRHPYGNITQVAQAMRTGEEQGPVMVRSNRYENLPDWMARLQTIHSNPITRQRLVDLQHEEESRRQAVEASHSKKTVVARRVANPTVLGKRELEPYNAQYPYKREMQVDRTPMRDESSLPRSSVLPELNMQSHVSVERHSEPVVGHHLRKHKSDSQSSHLSVPATPPRPLLGTIMNKLQTTIGGLADFLFPLEGYHHGRAVDNRQHYLPRAQRTSFAAVMPIITTSNTERGEPNSHSHNGSVVPQSIHGCTSECNPPATKFGTLPKPRGTYSAECTHLNGLG